MKKCFLLIFLLLTIQLLQAQTATAPSVGDGTSGNPYQIENLENLYWIAASNTRWASHYIQTADIDASATSGWFSNQGWTPIGNSTNNFTGTYNGQENNISDLYIDRTEAYLGLFGWVGESFGTDKGNVSNLYLVDVDITGQNNYIGGLTAYQESSSDIDNVHVSGTITGRTDVGDGSRQIGGVVGEARGSVTNCSFSGQVRGHSYIGGLIGESRAVVSNSFSSGTIETNKNYSGGLIGQMTDGSVTRSYSSVNISNIALYVYSAGGFIGQILAGTVSQCFSTGDVSGFRDYAGGFVGRNKGVINNCYSRDSVSRNGGSNTRFGRVCGLERIWKSD